MAKYKTYPEYRDSGVEWLGEIPIHWESNALKNICKIINGSTPKSGVEEFWDGEINWITPTDLSQKTGQAVTESIRKITFSGLNSCGTTLVPRDSVIISTRAPIGSLAITSIESCTNQGCKSLVTNDTEVSKFIYYYLSTITSQLNILGKGSTFLELSTEDLSSVRIPIPNERINSVVSFLDHETAKIDNLIKKQQQLIELLKEKRQAVISHAVTKGLNPDVPMKDSGVEWLGKVPNHWGVTSIKYFSEVKRGASPRPIDDPKYFDDEGEYAWTRIADVSKAGMYLTETTQRLSCLGSSLSVKLQANELFISIAGTVGKPCLTISKACIHDGFVYFPSLKLNNKFLFFIFDAGQAYQGLGKMGTQLNLNTETIGDIKIGIPPAVEISNIILYIEQQKNNYEKLIIAVHQAITLLKERRTALISAAVTGKIDVRHWRAPDEQTTAEAEVAV